MSTLMLSAHRIGLRQCKVLSAVPIRSCGSIIVTVHARARHEHVVAKGTNFGINGRMFQARETGTVGKERAPPMLLLAAIFCAIMAIIAYPLFVAALG